MINDDRRSAHSPSFSLSPLCNARIACDREGKNKKLARRYYQYPTIDALASYQLFRRRHDGRQPS